MDPAYEAADDHIFSTPEFEEAYQKWDENSEDGDVLRIKLNQQTKETEFDTIKAKKEL